MTASTAFLRMRQALIDAATRDLRIVGLISDGSYIKGTVDEWSDVDVALFIRDSDFDEFERNWKEWASTFGEPLLSYISWVGHPWTVFDADPLPLRVDFDLFRASEINGLGSWPVSANSVDAMLWYDGTSGELRSEIEELVGKSLHPVDHCAAFEQKCGDFWYDMLFTFSKLARGETWIARQAFHQRVLSPLLFLLRMEAGATEKWQLNDPAVDLESVVNRERLAQLDACLPDATRDSLVPALQRTAALGESVCTAIASAHGYTWPEKLAKRTREVLSRPLGGHYSQ